MKQEHQTIKIWKSTLKKLRHLYAETGVPMVELLDRMVSSQEGTNMITVEYANEIAEAAAQADGILKEVAINYLQDKIRQYPDPAVLNQSGKANMHIANLIQREIDLRKSEGEA